MSDLDSMPEQQPLTQRPLHSSAPKLSLNKAKFEVTYEKLRKKWTIRTTVRNNAITFIYLWFITIIIGFVK